MVSALTGRLLANYNSGYASSNSSSSSSSSSGEQGASASQRLSSAVCAVSQQSRSTSSGSPPSCYSIDRSTTSSATTNKRSFNESATTTTTTTCGSSSSNKRQKQQRDERAYAASTAFACLTKAGRKIPAIRTSCPRGLPPLSSSGIVNAGGLVTLVHSKNYSPPVIGSAAAASSLMLSWNDVELCSALIQATSAFYQIPASSSSSLLQKSSNNNSDTDSNNGTATSSVTDETSSNSSGENNEDAAAEKIISMGEALQITKHARLVTLASPPFNVVHVNAAYLSLTGLPSTSVLGRPLQDVFVAAATAAGDDDCQEAAADDWATSLDFELTQLHEASLQAKSVVTTARQEQDAASNSSMVKVCVTKIGAHPSKVSHFAVELHPSSANNAAAASSSADSLDAPIRRADSIMTAAAASNFGMVVA